jgi:hypothetical protein
MLVPVGASMFFMAPSVFRTASGRGVCLYGLGGSWRGPLAVCLTHFGHEPNVK